jgi:hypothetical protein
MISNIPVSNAIGEVPTLAEAKPWAQADLEAFDETFLQDMQEANPVDSESLIDELTKENAAFMADNQGLIKDLKEKYNLSIEETSEGIIDKEQPSDSKTGKSADGLRADADMTVAQIVAW